MDTELGAQIVRWTARLAVAAYVCRLLADVWCGRLALRTDDQTGRREDGRHESGATESFRQSTDCCEPLVRWIWTLGCVIYLLHVAAAFQFVHHWSHAAAFEHTARQTAALTGRHWGGGLWINYAFTLWWPLDVLWTWKRGLDRLPRWYLLTLHAIVGFLMINATLVFGPVWWRWPAGLVAGLAAIAALARCRRAAFHVKR